MGRAPCSCQFRVLCQQGHSVLSYTQGNASSTPRQAVCAETQLQAALTHVSNGPAGPGLLVWGCIALVCFSLNGEPSSAWQFLPPDISGIFFCGSETSLADATGGNAPLAVFAGGAHPSLLDSFPQLWLLRGHLSPPRGTQSITRALPSPQSPSAARGAAIRTLT